MGGDHKLHAWDLTHVGPPPGLACRRCHKTWIESGGILYSSYAALTRQESGE